MKKEGVRKVESKSEQRKNVGETNALKGREKERNTTRKKQ